MPLYVVRCAQCEARQEVFRFLKDIDDMPECHGQTMERVPCAPMVLGDIQPYRSMITGEMITSRSRHREHLRDHNCVEVGNETKYVQGKPPQPPPGLKDAVIKAVKQHTKSL